MITLKEFADRVFKTKEEAFACLKENEKKIISLKKSRIYKSCEKGQARLGVSCLVKGSGSSKGLSFIKAGNLYPVINTTKYMDSHEDVHLDGIWDRTLKHQDGQLYYVDNHSLQVDDVIAWPEDVKAFTEMIPWSAVGKSYDGMTQGLIYEIPKDKIQKASSLSVIENARKIENSVRMQYVGLKLAINSTSRELKENKEIFDEIYPLIANKERADETGYFWAVDEAKIHKEGSMVIAGSNDATAIIYNETDESGDSTSSKGPAESTPDPVASFYKNLI